MMDCYSDNILRGLCNYVQQPLSAAHLAAATERVMSRRERGSGGGRGRWSEDIYARLIMQDAGNGVDGSDTFGVMVRSWCARTSS